MKGHDNYPYLNKSWISHRLIDCYINATVI